MNVIEFDNGLNGSFLGDIFGKILNPTPDQSEQLANELFYKEQELAAAKTTTTYSMIAAGIFGVAAAYFGYKQFKK